MKLERKAIYDLKHSIYKSNRGPSCFAFLSNAHVSSACMLTWLFMRVFSLFVFFTDTRFWQINCGNVVSEFRSHLSIGWKSMPGHSSLTCVTSGLFAFCCNLNNYWLERRHLVCIVNVFLVRQIHMWNGRFQDFSWELRTSHFMCSTRFSRVWLERP